MLAEMAALPSEPQGTLGHIPLPRHKAAQRKPLGAPSMTPTPSTEKSNFSSLEGSSSQRDTESVKQDTLPTTAQKASLHMTKPLQRGTRCSFHKRPGNRDVTERERRVEPHSVCLRLEAVISKEDPEWRLSHALSAREPTCAGDPGRKEPHPRWPHSQPSAESQRG